MNLILPISFTGHSDALCKVLADNDVIQLFTGVEVGVRYGHNAYELLKRIPTLQLRLVDPYAAYMDVDNYFYEAIKQERIRQDAYVFLSKFLVRTLWIHEPSSIAINSVDDRSQDFVFIDANHSYDAVATDLRVWRSKIRPGGLLCGHDYSMDGVKRAVQEYAEQSNLPLQVVPMPADCWFLQV